MIKPFLLENDCNIYLFSDILIFSFVFLMHEKNHPFTIIYY